MNARADDAARNVLGNTAGRKVDEEEPSHEEVIRAALLALYARRVRTATLNRVRGILAAALGL